MAVGREVKPSASPSETIDASECAPFSQALIEAKGEALQAARERHLLEALVETRGQR